MSEDMARALASPGGKTVKIADKECTVRPLGIRELTEAERDCVERYKRGYLKTYADNADLLPGGGKGLVERKMDEVARWDIDDLPNKQVCDPDRIHLTKQLKAWAKKEYDLDDDATAQQYQRVVATALDQESLPFAEYEKLSGRRAMRTKVPYVNWWITGCFEGMITFVWICFKANGVTREQVEEELSKNQSLLIELSREIERLSAPSVGNG